MPLVCVQREKFKKLSVNFKVNITNMKKSFGKESYTAIIYIDRCAKKCIYNQNQNELPIDTHINRAY